MTTGENQVAEFVAARGIKEVLHFTTNKGCLGILYSKFLRSRQRLNEDQYIEHIYTPNCADRLKDLAWIDYVNLSISRANVSMLRTSRGWHPVDDLWWVVLAFDPSLLQHKGVVFTTTNNTYPSVCRRDGIEGLTAMYADSVEWGYHGTRSYRGTSMPTSYPTNVQAEVLYPGEVHAAWLRSIYVFQPDHEDTVRAWLEMTGYSDVRVAYKPEVFQ